MNTPAPPPADPGSSGPAAVERLGFAPEQIVQEVGWDDDSDDAFRFAVEDATGAELEDEDYTGETDAVLLWWRSDDGDLTDALVDLVGLLEDGGFIVVLTPRDRNGGAVDPSEVTEAAATAGLHTSGAFNASPEWRATKLVTPRSRR